MATPPRLVVPGQTHHLNIQAVNRQFRFVPLEDVVKSINFIFWHCVDVHKMAVHEMKWMSNHAHICITDVEGVLPKFMCQMNSLISRQLNALRGLTGTNIEKGYTAIEIVDAESLVSTSAYILANACAADLVNTAVEWKGLTTYELDYGAVFCVERPKCGMWSEKERAPVPKKHRKTLKAKKDGESSTKKKAKKRRRKPSKLPESVEGKLTRPDVLPDLTDDELRQKIRLETREKELKAANRRTRKNKKVLGMDNVLRRKWNEYPRKRQAVFEPEPRVSTRSESILINRLNHRSVFQQQYREALETYVNDGSDKALFPEGTWKMRTVFKAKCRNSETQPTA